MNFLAKFNDFFYRKTFSLFDWIGMITIVGLSDDNLLWLLALIPFIWVSSKLTNRFAPD